MSGEEKTARNERAAVAYAHRLVTNAGLMWRELTGQDIGIDAVIELPYADSKRFGSRGFVLVQIKSRSGAARRDRLSAIYKKRHDLYWLTQRLPVVLCVVEPLDSGDFSTAGPGHWIDYKSLKPAEFSISKSKDDKRWTLHVQRNSPNVWPQPRGSFKRWEAEARSFQLWVENVVVRPAEAIAAMAEEAATDLLGSGKPEQARTYLHGHLPLSEEVLLKGRSRQGLDMTITRAYRRLGAVVEQEQKVATYRDKGEPLPEFMQFELALTYWTHASMKPFASSDPAGWRKALSILGTPRRAMPAQVKELKRALIRSAAFVNIKATLARLSRRQDDAPTSAVLDQLERLVAAWEKSKEAHLDKAFQRHLLNALRAVCRGHLARADLQRAEAALRTLDRLMTREPDRDVLAVTDMLLLAAWISLETGKEEKAKGMLECARHLLNAMYDPLLKWLLGAIEVRAQELFEQDGSSPH